MRWILATSVVALAWGGLPFADGAGPDPKARSWDKYKVLIDRNVFCRDRARRPGPSAASGRPAPPPESYITLKGVAQVGSRFVAFLEDAHGGTRRVSVGDEVAGGKIKQITLDGLDFEKAAETKNVAVGGRLAAGPAPASGRARSASPGPAAASGPSRAPTRVQKGAEAAILERLRQRRMRETGKR